MSYMGLLPLDLQQHSVRCYKLLTSPSYLRAANVNSLIGWQCMVYWLAMHGLKTIPVCRAYVLSAWSRSSECESMLSMNLLQQNFGELQYRLHSAEQLSPC